jgi:hypothetical protein
MAEIKSESVADFIPESVAGLLRNQHRGAVALVIVGHRTAAAALHRQPRLGAVERLIWLFSSTDSTSACSGGLT